MAKKDRKKDEEEDEERWPRRRRDIFPGRRGFFGSSVFGDMEEEMEMMKREMDALMNRALSGELPSSEEGGPIVYGYSIRTDESGKPHVEEFGNTNLAHPFRGFRKCEREQEPQCNPMSREPITDVMEVKDEVWVTAELPGVEKDDIDVTIGEEEISISVETEKRSYHKTVELPVPVKDKDSKATYKNGVLDIRLKKERVKKDKGKKIKVE